MSENTMELSDAGNRRKEQILANVTREAARLRRRRLAIRVAFVCLIAALVTPGVMRLLEVRSPRQVVKIQPRAVPVSPILTPAAEPRVLITRIGTEPGLLAKLAMPAERPRWRRISDDQLLEALADAHRPAGLAYIDGKARLLFR